MRNTLYHGGMRFADMAELADAPDLGSGGRPCRFKSCYPHQVYHVSAKATASVYDPVALYTLAGTDEKNQRGDGMKSICGADCEQCAFSGKCSGCLATGGQPFGEKCIVAVCCQKGEDALNEFKEKLIAAFNGLNIRDMEEVTDLHALNGAFINITCRLPGGQTAKFWNDNKIYLGNQLHKKGSDRCYGIAADENYLMVSEYGEAGADAELVAFQRWN